MKTIKCIVQMLVFIAHITSVLEARATLRN